MTIGTTVRVGGWETNDTGDGTTTIGATGSPEIVLPITGTQLCPLLTATGEVVYSVLFTTVLPD